MLNTNRILRRMAAAVALAGASLALASAADAVDLRDWGKKYAPSERFIVLAQFNSQAVLDKETQLVWQRSPSNVLVTFQVARDSCAIATTGGRMGWRLPTQSEIRSLIEPASTDNYVPNLPAGHPFIGAMAYLGNGPSGNNYGRYWTTTLNVALDPTYRLAPTLNKTYATWVNVGTALAAAWCVRGEAPSGE